jgi:hypothetical protein
LGGRKTKTRKLNKAKEDKIGEKEEDQIIMKEGWINNEYHIIFDETEMEKITEDYGIKECLPGYQILELLGWDDFIISDGKQKFRIPTIPLTLEYIENYENNYDTEHIETDERLRGKIKWYIKPLIFSGNPNDDSNISWVNISQHQELVKFWNRQYQNIVKNR